MKKALIIGEFHSNEYNFTQICRELNFKPDLLLVEGPFEKYGDRRKNLIKDFFDKNPTYKKTSFIDINKEEYLLNRGINKDLEINGIENYGLSSFRGLICLLSNKYYELERADAKDYMEIDEKIDDKINLIFLKCKTKITPLFNYMTFLSNDKSFSKYEKVLIDWQKSVLQSILKQIDTGLNGDKSSHQIIFENYLHKTELFDKPMMFHSINTRNKMFVETIDLLNNKYDNIGIIVGEAHYNFIKNNLIRRNYNIIG